MAGKGEIHFTHVAESIVFFCISFSHKWEEKVSTTKIQKPLPQYTQHLSIFLRNKGTLSWQGKACASLRPTRHLMFYVYVLCSLDVHTSIYVGIMMQFPSFKCCSSPGLTTSFAQALCLKNNRLSQQVFQMVKGLVSKWYQSLLVAQKHSYSLTHAYVSKILNSN